MSNIYVLGVFYSYDYDTTKTKTSEKLTTSASSGCKKTQGSLKPDETHNPHFCVHVLCLADRSSNYYAEGYQLMEMYTPHVTNKKCYIITQCVSEHPYGQLPKAYLADQFIFHLISFSNH